MPLTHGANRQHHWRYLLKIDIHPTDAAILKDALDGERFGLRERLGAREIERQIDAFELNVDVRTLERWDDFEHDIETLSVYLSDDIVGKEIEVEPSAGAPLVRAWKIAGRRGEVVRLRLEAGWDARDASIVLGEEDRDELEKRWPDLPEWVRDAMHLKPPDTRQP
jgi:hypothetical protein